MKPTLLVADTQSDSLFLLLCTALKFGEANIAVLSHSESFSEPLGALHVEIREYDPDEHADLGPSGGSGIVVKATSDNIFTLVGLRHELQKAEEHEEAYGQPASWARDAERIAEFLSHAAANAALAKALSGPAIPVLFAT